MKKSPILLLIAGVIVLAAAFGTLTTYNALVAKEEKASTAARIAEAQRTQAERIDSMLAVAAALPQDSADEDTAELRLSQQETAKRLQAAQQQRRQAAESYNKALREFPASVVAWLFGFNEKAER